MEEGLEGGDDTLRLGRLDRRSEDVGNGQAGELQTRDVHGG